MRSAGRTVKTASIPENAIDPRILRSRHLILRAALEELGEAGYGAFTVESVAARSRVAKSTIYRHWPNKVELIADAFQTLHEEEGPDIETGSARQRVDRIVRHVSNVVVSSTFSACIPALIDGAERDGGVRDFHHRFQAEARQPLVAAITEGVTAGDFPRRPDPEFATQALLGVIFYRRLMTDMPFDPESSAELIDAVLGPASGRRRPPDRATRA